MIKFISINHFHDEKKIKYSNTFHHNYLLIFIYKSKIPIQIRKYFKIRNTILYSILYLYLIFLHLEYYEKY